MEGWVDRYLAAAGMVSMQFVYAILALMNRAALLKGMSPWAFIFYRQTIATLVISPFAYFIRYALLQYRTHTSTLSSELDFHQIEFDRVNYKNGRFWGLAGEH